MRGRTHIGGAFPTINRSDAGLVGGTDRRGKKQTKKRYCKKNRIPNLHSMSSYFGFQLRKSTAVAAGRFAETVSTV